MIDNKKKNKKADAKIDFDDSCSSSSDLNYMEN